MDLLDIGGMFEPRGGGFVDFETFGCVPVSGKGLFKLLRRGENVLLKKLPATEDDMQSLELVSILAEPMKPFISLFAR